MNSINKSNVTMWKNRDAANDKKPKKQTTITKVARSATIGGNKPENSKQIENEFIDNLKKQIYFMEMELKLMKEREREIAKSGGFTQLFNDDKDPSIHIQQLKVKYANMRKKMEDQIIILGDKKREVTGLNVSLKAKLASLQKLEQDILNKLKNLENNSNTRLNELNTNFIERDNERNDVEATNRLNNTKLKATLDNNENLDYTIKAGDRMSKMDQEDFDADMKLMDDLTDAKIQSLDSYNEKIKQIEQEAQAIPYFKEEINKNEEYKKRIVLLKDEVLKLNTEAEAADMVNNFLIKKKNDVIAERKKYIDLNIELKHEIEAKNTLNDTRIQKKVRELNSEEIQNLTEHLNETNDKIKDLEAKIAKEIEKIHKFTQDIIRANIQLAHKEEKKEELEKDITEKSDELKELKETDETLEKENNALKDKIGKEKNDNGLLRNKHKKLSEEDAGVTSKLDFITTNYDFTTNLKRISMEDLKNLAQSNNMVNTTIDNFVDKVGTFKRNNIQDLLDDRAEF